MFKILKRLGLSVLVCMFMFSTILVTKADYVEYIGDIPVISVDDFDKITYEDTVSYEEMREYLVSIGAAEEEITDLDSSNSVMMRSSNGGQLRYSLLKLTKHTVNTSYITQIRVTAGMMFYPNSNGDYSNPRNIVNLEGAHVYTGDGAKSVFTGTIIIKLVNYNTIYYNFYGDLYKAGQVNWTIGGSVGIGGTASINGSISNGNGFIKNISFSKSQVLTGIG